MYYYNEYIIYIYMMSHILLLLLLLYYYYYYMVQTPIHGSKHKKFPIGGGERQKTRKLRHIKSTIVPQTHPTITTNPIPYS